MKILFICTGNTCRSPMAEGIFRELLHKNGETTLMCQSAGLSAKADENAAENAIQVCSEIGIDISEHQSRRFTPEELPVWDLYFTMSKTHAYILEQGGVPADRIYVSSYIEDPFGGDLATYRAVRDKLISELDIFYQTLLRFWRRAE